MSYWVYLEDADSGESVPAPNHTEGGTYAVGGVAKAELNVTWNYSEQYSRFGFSLKHLNGLKASEATIRLTAMVAALGTETGDDYWEPTPGNAGKALAILLGWARANPEAVFRVS